MLTESATRTVLVANPDGLHIRVCAAIVKAVGTYRAKVTIRKESQIVDAVSMFGLMLLAASQGTELILSARGPEAREALEAVAGLLEAEPEMAFAV